MLPIDSIVIDLIFQRDVSLEPDDLVTALGGTEFLATRKLLDPDMHGPQFEMQLSPSRPFRRHDERRLMLVDDNITPIDKKSATESTIPVDVSDERDRLIEICTAMPVRLGRVNALGLWGGDAVLVARTGRDLRGIALLPWVLDPTVDVDGKRRGTRLTQQEFETKIAAYERRLDELDDAVILNRISGARIERRDDLIVVDVLEEDGTWDVQDSQRLLAQLAAVDAFSLVVGAPSSANRMRPPGKSARPDTSRKSSTVRVNDTAKPPAAAVAKPTDPLTVGRLGDRSVLIFTGERFDLDVAAALGKKDYGGVMHQSDRISGAEKDEILRHGADFVAPLEFLSEVFVDGKPLSRPQFDQEAQSLTVEVNGGIGAVETRAMAVHCPRFGPVVLLDIAGTGRFITSAVDSTREIVALLLKH